MGSGSGISWRKRKEVGEVGGGKTKTKNRIRTKQPEETEWTKEKKETHWDAETHMFAHIGI